MSRLIALQDLLQRLPLPYVPDGARLEQLRSRLPLIVWVRHLLDGAARILWFSVGLFFPVTVRARVPSQNSAVPNCSWVVCS